jgi:tetratricopeptide (TPR) repeat protein
MRTHRPRFQHCLPGTFAPRRFALIFAAGSVWFAGCNTTGGSAGGGVSDPRAAEITLAAEQAAGRGERDVALQQFAKAIEVNPRFVRAHLGMADIYRIDGNYAAAEKSYGTAAGLEPRNFDAQYNHGLMLHVLNRVAEAVGAYIRALRVKPDDFQANLNLATAYYQLGENAQAIPYAERAVKLNPRNGAARLNLGSIYAAMGRNREALAEYEQASETMELTPALLTNLAEAYGRLDRFEQMRNTLLELVNRQPTAQTYERLGFASFKLGRTNGAMYATALANFEKSLSVDPEYYPALNGLGVCMLNLWLESDRRDGAAKDKALDCLRRSVQLNPDQPRVLELLSRYTR